MAASQIYVSDSHIFSVEDVLGTYSGVSYADDPTLLDTAETVIPAYTDKDGNVLYGVDSEFGFHVSDFYGAEDKTLDGDYGEGFAGNVYDETDPALVTGISLRNAETDLFLSGAVLGTWAMGLGGQTVKASTEHYNTMAKLLSDQAFPDDPNAVYKLDNDLKLRDLHLTESGAVEAGVLNELYANELSAALQKAMDNIEEGVGDQTYADQDFDHDGVMDEYTTTTAQIWYDDDGDGVADLIDVAAVDLDGDGQADIADKVLNGIGGTADLADLMEANESTVLHDIAYGDDYSVTVKDDGKLLYRWGTAVKRPNDIRLESDLDLPTEWTEDSDANGVADILENGHNGYVVTKAELIINHEVTNNPNDQVRPEDWENEAAIGRLPSYYVVQDPDDPSNILWVSPVDSYDGSGNELPSYFVLDANGQVDLDPQIALTHDAVYDPNGRLVGYRNQDDAGNPTGTVLRDMSLVAQNAAADMAFSSSDLTDGYTAAWYTSVDREPFEWSYDKHRSDPYIQVFESFRTRAEAEAEGYTDYDLVSGPRWRLTPNKFGQDLPGLEIPLEPNSEPPFDKYNIKYETGEDITTRLNLLDWHSDTDGDGRYEASPLSHSLGWMTIDVTTLDADRDGRIDEGWSSVNGTLNAGDLLPTDPILYAVSPNGQALTAEALDIALYLKGDRQDSTQIYDMYMEIEYSGVIGSVDYIDGVKQFETTATYSGGAHYVAPVVIAYMNSYNGKQVATVSLTDVSSDSASFRIVEPNYLDGSHVKESVAMMALESGTWELVDGSRVAVGSVSVAEGETTVLNRGAVTFDHEFDDVPLVLAQLQTNNGLDWAVVRVSNVTTTGFNFFIQEEEAADGIHGAEVVGYVAIDAADASGILDWGSMLGQAVQIDSAVNHLGGSYDFDPSMGLDPLVLAGLTSTNGRNTAYLRQTDLDDDTAVATGSFIVQEEASQDEEILHTFEDVAGLAFETEGVLAGDAFVFV